jgi:threonine dehydratase
VTLEPATTIADGIAVRRAGDVTLPVVERYVDEIVTVNEDEIASAILTLLEREKTLAEGAGAAGLAAVLQHRTSLPAFTRTAVIVGGGNIDVTLLSRIIERGLVQDGRLIRLRIHLLDRPGALADLTQIIAAHRANIVDTLHNRAYYGVNLGDTVIDITMETRGREQVEELLAALTAAGYKHSRVL